MLREAKGNMYSFISHTWNPIKGKCSHNCVYCYMKRFSQKRLRLDGAELKTDLGSNNFIFIGSSTDMFAWDVPAPYINRVLEYASQFPSNRYLFQSKNPMRFKEFIGKYPPITMWGTTIETDNEDLIKQVSLLDLCGIEERAHALHKCIYPTMVTIEPIMSFDLQNMVRIITRINPEWVNIGADSGGNGLIEPSKEQVLNLVAELIAQGVTIKLKDNLQRLLKGGKCA